MTRRFRRRPVMAGNINISDNVLIIEGGLPKEDMPAPEQQSPEAQAAPTPAHATSSTVRRFRPKPRPVPGEEGMDGVIRFRIVGGLPDWRHRDENMAIARAEYAQQQREEQDAQQLADAFATDVPTDSPNQPEVSTGDDHGN